MTLWLEEVEYLSNMKINNTIVIKSIQDIAGVKTSLANASREVKSFLVENYINHSKYTFLGCVDRTCDAILVARYHNVRDFGGRFAKVKIAR